MPDLVAKIRSALDEYDREADAERLEERLRAAEETRGRDFTKAELKRVLAELDDDDRDEIVSALVGEERWSAIREAEEEPATSEGAAESDDEPATPERRTRPGRKTGLAYDWEVDERGNVVDLRGQPARIYSGDDEPDEVELPEDELEELPEDAELEHEEDAA